MNAHAGICAGGGQQRPSLPRLPHPSMPVQVGAGMPELNGAQHASCPDPLYPMTTANLLGTKWSCFAWLQRQQAGMRFRWQDRELGVLGLREVVVPGSPPAPVRKGSICRLGCGH